MLRICAGIDVEIRVLGQVPFRQWHPPLVARLSIPFGAYPNNFPHAAWLASQMVRDGSTISTPSAIRTTILEGIHPAARTIIPIGLIPSLRKMLYADKNHIFLGKLLRMRKGVNPVAVRTTNAGPKAPKKLLLLVCFRRIFDARKSRPDQA